MAYVPRSAQAKPPEKGSFPLDHFHECDKMIREYKECLEKHENIGSVCKPLAKEYLKCRMEKGLMQQEDFNKLGFKEKYEDPDTLYRKHRRHKEDQLPDDYIPGMKNLPMYRKKLKEQAPK